MSKRAQAIFATLGGGAYAPVSTDSKDEEAEGPGHSLDDSFAEKRSVDRSNLRSFLKPVLQSFLVIALMVGSYVFGSYSSRTRRHSTGFVPYIPFIPGEPIFTDDDAWIVRGKESDALWSHMYATTSDQKFIKVDDPSQPLDDLDHYSLSVYHQLHCLAMFRALIYDPPSPESSGHGHHTHWNNTEADWYHLGHCFNYVRQAIRCTADTTLEYPPHNHTPGMKHSIRRTGNRQCRDIEALDAFVEENKWEYSERGEGVEGFGGS